MKNLEYEACALYDGGWRSTDKEQMMDDYDLTEEQASLICEVLRVLEEIENS